MQWELAFMKWGHGWWSTPILDQVIPFLTHLGSHYAVVLFILLSWALTRQKRILGHLVLLYGVLFAVTYSLKFLIHRQRPLYFLGMVSRATQASGEILDPSFPSAHTIFAFMMATLLSSWFPRYRVIFFITACFVGWTRIYLSFHYPTDVIAGAILGYGVTRLFLHWSNGLDIKAKSPQS